MKCRAQQAPVCMCILIILSAVSIKSTQVPYRLHLVITLLLSLLLSLLLGVCSAESNADTLDLSKVQDTPPQLQLAKIYQSDMQLENYLVSEKLDGVRGVWTGTKLVTRKGNAIDAPDWFIAQLPKGVCVEGELWRKRDDFETISALVRTKQQTEHTQALWKQVKLMLFDAPCVDGNFAERYMYLKQLSIGKANVGAIEQKRVSSNDELFDWLDDVVTAGGEGLMLHKMNARYFHGRTDNIVKLKPKHDAEAKVVAYTAGKGKYQGMVGALVVELEDGIRFKIGSGLTDVQRQSPPPSTVLSPLNIRGYQKGRTTVCSV
ncbi:DNA ligase [Shewanella maritima]|uniref:DNA ligase n=1 Tax=Shewanella maritima TaxID=2520507 RepID=A0A411PDB4_9GAMM|nr:DNA ligase [Shewanella maritima]QBF81498.1 DNA ligase [Shewanella maritima]